MSKVKQPSAKECFVCGVENPVGLKVKFYETAPGEVAVDFVPPQHYQGYPGVLHGGIVAAILDETAGRALMGIASPRFMFTAKLEVRYRKNVPVNVPLKIIGKTIKDRGRVAEGWSGLYDAGGELLAEATVLLVNVPNPPDSTELASWGWKVYPD